MLASYLAREFARKAAPTPKENREKAAKRLGIETGKVPREQVQALLLKDNEFIRGQVLNGMSFEFAELLGFILYRALGADLAVAGPNILSNGSFPSLSEQLDFDLVKKRIWDQEFEEKDVLAVVWWVFLHVLDEMIGGGWRSSYLVASNKIRFLHSSETRKRLHEGAVQLHKFTERTELTRTWAVGMKPGKGLFGLVRAALVKD